MKQILVIDDDAAFLAVMRSYLASHHPGLSVTTCSDPVLCLKGISRDLDLLLVDLEMPGLDGSKVLAYAQSRGIDKNRVVILSGRDADYLHRRFPLGSCLAVLNKTEAKQKEVLDMLFSQLERMSDAPAGDRPGIAGRPS